VASRADVCADRPAAAGQHLLPPEVLKVLIPNNRSVKAPPNAPIDHLLSDITKLLRLEKGLHGAHMPPPPPTTQLCDRKFPS